MESTVPVLRRSAWVLLVPVQVRDQLGYPEVSFRSSNFFVPSSRGDSYDCRCASSLRARSRIAACNLASDNKTVDRLDAFSCVDPVLPFDENPCRIVDTCMVSRLCVCANVDWVWFSDENFYRSTRNRMVFRSCGCEDVELGGTVDGIFCRIRDMDMALTLCVCNHVAREYSSVWILFDILDNARTVAYPLNVRVELRRVDNSCHCLDHPHHHHRLAAALCIATHRNFRDHPHQRHRGYHLWDPWSTLDIEWNFRPAMDWTHLTACPCHRTLTLPLPFLPPVEMARPEATGSASYHSWISDVDSRLQFEKKQQHTRLNRLNEISATPVRRHHVFGRIVFAGFFFFCFALLVAVFGCGLWWSMTGSGYRGIGFSDVENRLLRWLFKLRGLLLSIFSKNRFFFK